MAVLKKAWMARQARAAGDQDTAALGPPCAVRRGSVAVLCRIDLAGCAGSACAATPVDAAQAAINSDEATGLHMAEGKGVGIFNFCHRHVGFCAKRQLSAVKN